MKIGIYHVFIWQLASGIIIRSGNQLTLKEAIIIWTVVFIFSHDFGVSTLLIGLDISYRHERRAMPLNSICFIGF